MHMFRLNKYCHPLERYSDEQHKRAIPIADKKAKGKDPYLDLHGSFESAKGKA